MTSAEGGADANRMRRSAAFVDRDGTLNVDSGYLKTPDEVVLVPGAAAGVRALAHAGFAIVVVSNQSGIARGYLTEADADRVDERVRELLAREGAPLTAMYRCPHLPDAGCDCRKPKPGMLTRASAELDLDLRASWMIGDKAADMAAGRAAGCRCVSVPGVPAHQPPEDLSAAPPEYRAADLADAARFVIAHAAAVRPAESAR
jgi:histidinol-phosphate phosphatase family protein